MRKLAVRDSQYHSAILISIIRIIVCVCVHLISFCIDLLDSGIEYVTMVTMDTLTGTISLVI
jgi:hypothetical protein